MTALPAVFCGAEEPISGALCRRLACDGQHTSDGDECWSDTPNDNEDGSQ